MEKQSGAELLQIGEREFAISNPGKLLFPQAGLTKLDLVPLLPGRRAGRGARRRWPA